MAKPLALTADALALQSPTPAAATAPRGAPTAAPAATKSPDEEVIPLQVRLPRGEVRAIKLAAAAQDLTISELVLQAFKTYQQTR